MKRIDKSVFGPWAIVTGAFRGSARNSPGNSPPTV